MPYIAAQWIFMGSSINNYSVVYESMIHINVNFILKKFMHVIQTSQFSIVQCDSWRFWKIISPKKTALDTVDTGPSPKMRHVSVRRFPGLLVDDLAQGDHGGPNADDAMGRASGGATTTTVWMFFFDAVNNGILTTNLNWNSNSAPENRLKKPQKEMNYLPTIHFQTRSCC